MRLKHLGERRVIAKIRRSFDRGRKDVLVGIGDDAALVRTPGSLLLTTDVLVEDEDFRLADHPPRLLGRKALNVNLSDIAAMGGRPSTPSWVWPCPGRSRRNGSTTSWPGSGAPPTKRMWPSSAATCPAPRRS